MKAEQGKNKAAMAYQILGPYLPDEVFEHLSNQEIEKLLETVEKNRREPSAKEERSLLLSFTQFLQKRKPPAQAPKTLSVPINDKEFSLYGDSGAAPIADFLESVWQEEKEKQSSAWETIANLSQAELSALALDESPQVIARILAFAEPEMASEILVEYPDSVREEIILSLAHIDYHSERERDEMSRFYQFKSALIEQKTPVGKIRNRKAKTAGDLLSRLPWEHSQNLIERLQKKSPAFAETIIEHYYRLEDLLLLGRTSLTRFFSEIHPLVIACALKGVETSFKDSIFEHLEAWLVKEIRLEWDSLGPVSLLEIEEAQKGILDRLRDEIETGKLKLWRLK
ncbi:flagellar motor switch protein FliG [Leptospira ryugenii]|uniref:Flagellar motor switch protein FliG n=1 Tax=Leptospira ryugenii TaxID=1917863 RepID=A0A2P2E4E7_9LEPT|nr:FliG C-terminal domain-containing protein [Leptospira ryugenii]GBF51747.1 flagellar motor switch protein FliG [Leptospira ryugenii]